MKKPMYEIPGTIAYALVQNISKWNTINNINQLKGVVTNIINESDIKNPQDRLNFISIINSSKNMSSLMSTLGTYVTGLKV